MSNCDFVNMFRITGFQSIQYRHMFNISIFHSSLMRERKFGECFHIGLAVAIILIIKKIEPAYSMIAGAFVGGVIGGAGLEGTVSCMITGAQSIMPEILRIVTSGILAGVLIQSGAAVKIADQIIRIFGEKRALFSLALATMILTAVGVFGDVAVITVAPIAMVIG